MVFPELPAGEVWLACAGSPAGFVFASSVLGILSLSGATGILPVLAQGSGGTHGCPGLGGDGDWQLCHCYAEAALFGGFRREHCSFRSVAHRVSRHGIEGLAGLHGEGLEPPLDQVARASGVMRRVPAHRMGVGEPAEEGGQLPVPPRPEEEMPVVGQQAIGRDPGGEGQVRTFPSFDEP